MKKPPKHAPRRIASTADLAKFQRLMAAAMMRPLTDEDGLQARWTDWRSMQEVAAEFVKPNDRLTSFERLEIYSKSYWFRLFDAIRDDCPGLISVLGDQPFNRLAQAYLARHPSSSFTLRNLCSKLESFMRAHPRLTAPHTALALDVARFEWAQTVAFDDVALPVVTAADLGGTPPSRLRLRLQPYVSLLDLSYPVDDYLIRIKRRDALRGNASNAPVALEPEKARRRKPVLPRRSRTYVAVHRLNNRLFYKRLEPAAFRILRALESGAPLSRAVASAGRAATPAKVRRWFKVWMALGWFGR